MPGNDLAKIRTDPTVKVDPVATLSVYYSRLMDDVWRRLQGAKGKPPAHLIAQAHAIANAMERVDAKAAALMRAGLSRQYAASSLAAQKTVELAGVPVLSAGFGDFDRRAARALIERTTSNLGAIRESLFRGLVLADPSSKATVQAIEAALAGDNQLVQLDDGRVSVKVPSGRFWSPPAYARMIGRTAIADARRVAFRHRYLANGIDLVEIVANGSDHDECLAWEGVIVSLTGATKGYPTMDEARADGLFHPNCRHRYVAALGVDQPEIPLGEVDVADPDANFTTLGQAQGVSSRAPAPTPKGPPRAPRAPRATAAPAPPAASGPEWQDAKSPEAAFEQLNRLGKVGELHNKAPQYPGMKMRIWGAPIGSRGKWVEHLNNVGRGVADFARMFPETGFEVRLLIANKGGAKAAGRATSRLPRNQAVLMVGSEARFDLKGREWVRRKNGTAWLSDEAEAKMAADRGVTYSDADAVRHTLRHEYGHVLTGERGLFGGLQWNMDGTARRVDSLTVDGKTWNQHFHANGARNIEVEVFDQRTGEPRKRYVNFWQKNVSEYASKNADEAFAETFALYTSPHYQPGHLPRHLERFMEAVLGITEHPNARAAAAPAAPRASRAPRKSRAPKA